METSVKLKLLKGAKIFLIVISVLGCAKMLIDYDKINRKYMLKKQHYELLKQVHVQTLSVYNIDLSKDKQLGPFMDLITHYETQEDSIPNTNLVDNYYWIFIIGGLIFIYLIPILRKKEEELQGLTVDLENDA